MTLRPVRVPLKCDACAATVEGWEDPSWPGLAVTRMHAHGHDGRVIGPPALDAWVVTHVKSGVVVGAGYEDRALAEHALALLGGIPGADWTRSAGELQSPGFREEVAVALAHAQGLSTGMPGGATDLGDV